MNEPPKGRHSSHPDAGQADGVPQVHEVLDVAGVDPQKKEDRKNNDEHNGFAWHDKPPEGPVLGGRNFKLLLNTIIPRFWRARGGGKFFLLFFALVYYIF